MRSACLWPGKKDGFGSLVWPDGARYEGQVVYICVRLGQGHRMHVFLLFQLLRKYVLWLPQYKTNQRHGYGKMVYSDRARYRGQYYEGRPHGEGRCSRPRHHHSFSLECHTNVFHGADTLSYGVVDACCCVMVAIQMHVVFRFQWQDGRVYFGSFNHGKKHGQVFCRLLHSHITGYG